MEIKEGTYTLEGNKIFIEGKQLAVLERKKDIERKPKNYLAVLFPKFEYISGLFPKGEKGKFVFDTKKELFELELLEGEGKAVLKKLEPIQGET
jgi:hypothetical protein